MDVSGKEAVHVAFGISIAANIRKTFRLLGCRARVIGCPDDLSVGPIDPPDAATRARWIGENLGNDDDYELIPFSDAFWAEATSSQIHPVAWVCRRHASEYAGFLEFVWRMADAPFRVVDASHVKMPQWHGSADLWSLGVISPKQIVEAGLIERQAALSATARDRYRDEWRRLRAENASIRVVGDDGLVSAPITHFDEVIAACATPEWRKGAWIVGEAMGELLERPFAQCPCDMLLWSRVLALGEAGRIEVRGTGPDMRGHEVRRV